MDKRLLFFGLLFLLVYGLSSILYGERMTYQKGLGWDGKTYYELTVNFEENLLQHKISPYYMQRILPCAIAYYSLQVLSVEINESSVCNAFLAMSLVTLLFSYWLWILLLGKLDFGIATGRLGTVLLFVTFPVLKLTFYYPVLTDCLAFSFGIFALYFWVSQRSFFLLGFGIIGNFIWPSFFYFVVPLFLFPFRKYLLPAEKVPPQKLRISFLLALLSGLAMAAMSIYAVQYLGLTKQNEESQINSGLIIVSASLAGFYLVLALEPLLETLKIRYLISLISKGLILRSVVVLISFVGMALFIQHFKGEGFAIGIRALFRGVALRSTAQPLIFLVSHLIYFGPAVAIFVINYKAAIKAISDTGVGLLLLMYPVLFLSLNSESRGMINFFPFVVFIILPRIKEIVSSKFYVFLLIFMSFLFSKIYFFINSDQGYTGIPQKFPDQRYFMHFGPWMTQESYLINLSMALAMLVMIYLMYRKHFLSDRI